MQLTIISILAFFTFSLFLNFLLYKFPFSSLSIYQNKKIIPYTGGVTIFICFSLYDINNPYYPFYLVIFLLGLIDDWIVLKWKQKLIGQLIICIGLVFNGFNIEWFDCIWLDWGISLLWLVGFTNAFNLLDNMDGLCGGVVIIILAFLVLLTGNMGMLILVVIVAGFMVWNLKGRIWMGDSGSLFLGLFMAINVGQLDMQWWRYLLLMALPLVDTTFVTIQRLLKGRRPWHGGKDHLSHQLVRLGFSEKRAVEVLWLVTLLIGGLAIWL